MKFVCLGYCAREAWDAVPKGVQDARIEECFAYDDELRNRGHWLDGGQALQTAQRAKTLCFREGKVLVTDGPFAETKEQLGGLGVLEARDMDQAVEIMSRHPGIQIGPFEIRPLNEEAIKRQAAAVAQRRGDQAAATSDKAKTPTFACLGYIDEKRGAAMSQGEFAAMIEECVAFDRARQHDGHWVSALALQGAATAKTVRFNEGKVLVTDGPFAETKEQLGGVVVNRFKDISQAVALLSKHPALRFGVVIEIRPIDEDMNARWEARRIDSSGS